MCGGIVSPHSLCLHYLFVISKLKTLAPRLVFVVFIVIVVVVIITTATTSSRCWSHCVCVCDCLFVSTCSFTNLQRQGGAAWRLSNLIEYFEQSLATTMVMLLTLQNSPSANVASNASAANTSTSPSSSASSSSASSSTATKNKNGGHHHHHHHAHTTNSHHQHGRHKQQHHHHPPPPPSAIVVAPGAPNNKRRLEHRRASDGAANIVLRARCNAAQMVMFRRNGLRVLVSVLSLDSLYHRARFIQ